MNLQISIIGMAIIAVLYWICGAVLLKVWRRVRGRTWGKVLVPLVAFVVLILPWADEVWIAWHFSEFCKDAGVRVVRKVEVEGYYDATTTGWSKSQIVTNAKSIAEYEKAGFRFRERNIGVMSDSPGQISHLEKYSDGTWRITILDRPTARYHYKRIIDYRDARGIHHEAPVAYGIWKSGEVVVDAETNETIGSNLRFTRFPGWIDGLWVRFLGGGGTSCPDWVKGPFPPPFPDAALVPPFKQ